VIQAADDRHAMKVTKSQERPQDGLMDPRWLFAIRFLIAAAIGLAGYLLWVSLSGGAVAGCGPESNCDKVLHSRWARWLGLPVSAIALLIYLAIFAGTFWLRRTVAPAQQRAAWRGLIPGAVTVIGAALWFGIVQAFILKSFCPFCMTAHGCGLVASGIILWRAPFRNAPEKPWQQAKQVFVPPPVGRKLALIALAGVALLVAGQFVRLPRREYVVTMFDGKIQMNLREVPLLGAPDAPYSMVSLFDYTCHHCRIMHGHLLEAHRKYSNQLAIVSLPMPLCEKCNHTLKRTPKVHAEACEYARIGLAVWRANRKVQSQFDDWVFGPASPPPLSEVRAYASQLAGPVALEAALKDPWIEQQIERDVSIYETNSLRGVANMPQLIIGTNVASGTFGQAEELYRLLSDKLGLKSG
jgi:uncharacterized membrane protein